MPRLDLTGQKFEKLTAIEPAPDIEEAQEEFKDLDYKDGAS